MATAMTARERGPAIAGTAIAVAGCALAAGTLGLVLLDVDSAPWWLLPGLSREWSYGLRLAVALVGLFTMAIVAGLIARRQPRSLLTWAFTAAMLVSAISMFTAQYAIHGLLVAPGSLPLADGAARVPPFLFPVLVICYLIAILVFPDGRLLSPSWRVVVSAAFALTALDLLQRMDGPYPIALGIGGEQTVPVTVPPALWPIGAAFSWAARWVYWGTYFLFAAVAMSVILRLRASSGETRQQLKWFAYATSLAALSAILSMLPDMPALEPMLKPVADTFRAWGTLSRDLFSLILIPAAIAIAILRYRLYDIDVVINRTIVYGGLAAFVTVAYASTVATVGAIIGGTLGAGPVATIAAIALIAALLEPVRARLNALANMAIYGKRANPYGVLSDFARSVRDAASSDVLLPRMAGLVRDATGATTVEVWVRVGDRLHLAAVAPAAPLGPQRTEEDLATHRADPSTTVVPVFVQEERLGALVIHKARGELLSVNERHLLDDLASQAGLVFSRFRLVEELRESRARIVAAQVEERRRVERDLHDGAQQRFVNAMLSVGMAQALDGRGGDPADLLAQASREMQAGLTELRALARGLHPPLLTDEGLPAAIASLADRSPILTSVRVVPERRYNEAVEATAYFVVAEALANAAKHSKASSIDITIDERDGRLLVEVKDDGVGGVDPQRGSGIVGLRDRAAAVGGRLDIDSSRRGTVVRAELPCA